MATSRGVAAIFALTKGTTWGTAATFNAGNKGFRPLSFSCDPGAGQLRDESYNASPGRRQSELVETISPSGSYSIDLKYEGLMQHLAIFFGTAGIPTGSNPYLHTLKVKSDMTGIFGTLAWHDGAVAHVVDSMKYKSIKLSTTAGGALVGEFAWEGRKLTRTTEASSVQFGSVTEPANIDRVQTKTSVFTASTAAQGGALAAFSPGLASWETTLTREWSENRTGSNAPYRDEPDAGRLDVEGKFTQQPKQAATYPNLLESPAAQKLKFAYALTAVTKEFNLWLPHARFTGADDGITNVAGMPLAIDFVCDLATTSQSGYPDTLAALTIYNADSADPLA